MRTWKYEDSAIKTVPVKIAPKNDFLSFMQSYNKIFNLLIDICFKKEILEYKTLNAKCYNKFRKLYPNIPAAVIQCIEKLVVGTIRSSITKYLKANKLIRNEANILIALQNIKKPYKKQYSAILFNKGNISFLKGNILSFSSFLSSKRTKQKVKIPKCYKQIIKNGRFKCGSIRFDYYKQQFFANLYFENTPDKPDFTEIPSVLGIDRGLDNLVYASNKSSFSSKALLKKKRQYKHNRSKLQSKGTRSSKRCLQRLAGREKRLDENVNNIISKMIANSPYNIFVLEDLSGIRKQKSKGKYFNGLLNSWSFFKFENQLMYKCRDLGKIVVKVNPYMTSQRCYECGFTHKSNRKGSVFKCKECQHVSHADLNASKNIMRKFLLEPRKYIKDFDMFFEVGVNQPNELSKMSNEDLMLLLRFKVSAKDCECNLELGTINCNQ